MSENNQIYEYKYCAKSQRTDSDVYTQSRSARVVDRRRCRRATLDRQMICIYFLIIICT